ncbi:putative integral membrane sensor protein [Caenispirillum salinarum AK4]|uniref:histidine kinase n=1 Tax=Caenispirillum salinarum AK4 TaxID=1238182 RepID=K9HGD5_9PROT|nr:HAMP domain-containing sensor histidine kinase [Caenispirillum salinarum]EKV27666.1 putative integral membrane sensor protein [Caenispirillum salinarum AK4]
MPDLTAAVVDALPMSGCLVDQEGVIVAVSDEWRRFGEENGSLDADFGLGTNYVAICGASSDASIRAIGRGVKSVLAGDREDFRHVYSCHAPWEVRWYRVSCRHVKAEGQRMALVVHTSITGEVLKGSMAKEAERDIARLGAERAELLQRLSDELRAPLNTIIGLSDMLSQAVFGPLGNARYEDYAAEIGGSGRRLRALVDDVVELSLMDGGELPLREDTIDLAALCDDIAEEWRERAEERRVDIFPWAPGDLPPLRADGGRVRQMIGHLLDNALDAAPEDSRVTLEAAEDAAGCLTITVTDVGAGLPRNDPMRLTEPFYKAAGPAVDPEHPGLGLALTRGLIEAHGGRLMLRARPRRGTAVTLRFPQTRSLRAAG